MNENINGAPSLTGLAAWRPIETAPKDGTEIILYSPNGGDTPRVTAGFWLEPEGEYLGDCGGECRCPEFGEAPAPFWYSGDGGFTDEHAPTLWQPLPAPPGSDEPSAAAHETAREVKSSTEQVIAELCEAAQAVVDCWGVGSLNITAMCGFVDDLRATLARAKARGAAG